MESERPKELPSWSRPPLDEVALAVQFGALPGLQTIHYGALRDLYLSQFGGDVEERPPIDPNFETLDSGFPVQQMKIQLIQGLAPPLRRIWLVSPDKHSLLQIQADRFVQNWRRVEGEGEYPRFHSILPDFVENFALFDRFAAEHRLGDVKPNQFEISYFNNLPLLEGETYLNAFSRIMRVTPLDLAKLDAFSGKIEPETEALNLTFRILNGDDAPVARLHATGKAALVGKSRVIRLDLVCRAPASPGLELPQAFHLGRETIVRTFDALLSDEGQKHFGRNQ
jgi:uncharacterized protein (TIGR04255 family)